MDTVEVRLLVGDPESFATTLWASERTIKELLWYQKKKEKHRGAFFQKLERYARDGFSRWEGPERPIRHEWDGVFRIGDSSLFRVIGFYAAGKSEFIACDAYLKSGQKLSAVERGRIDTVAGIRGSGSWRKVESSGHR